MGDIEFCNIDTFSYLNNVKDTNFLQKCLQNVDALIGYWQIKK